MPSRPLPHQEAPAPNRISRPALPHPVPVGAPARHRPTPAGSPAPASPGTAGSRAGARAEAARRPAAHLREAEARRHQCPGRSRPPCPAPGPALPEACWQPYCWAGLSPRGQHRGQGGRAWVDGGLRGPRLPLAPAWPRSGATRTREELLPGRAWEGPLGVPRAAALGLHAHRGPSRQLWSWTCLPGGPEARQIQELWKQRGTGQPEPQLLRSGNPRVRP